VSRLSTSFVLGFHGCDQAVARDVISGSLNLTQSDRDYDWLGPGTYFWEADSLRAREWAEDKARRREIAEPAVVGAVIDLGNCLDLLVRENLELLRNAHAALQATVDEAGLTMPRNSNPRGHSGSDDLLRYLDCAVIRHLHDIVDESAARAGAITGVDMTRFDTVRGLFVEGDPIYPGSGFRGRTHTQIAVRSPAAIKGYFVPRP